MNHAITLGDIAFGLGSLAGAALIALGLLMIFAGGMSDDPTSGEGTSSTGCLVLIGGAALALLCLRALL